MSLLNKYPLCIYKLFDLIIIDENNICGMPTYYLFTSAPKLYIFT